MRQAARLVEQRTTGRRQPPLRLIEPAPAKAGRGRDARTCARAEEARARAMFGTFLFVLIALVGSAIQHYSGFGRRLYAIGSNRRTANIAGVHVKLVVTMAFVVSSLCAALSGMLLVGYAGGAALNMGDPYFLTSIAIVVVGGSSILGGRGSFLGTVAAAIFLTTISTIVQALGIAQGWQTFIYGFLIVAVLGLLRKDIYVHVGRLFQRRTWGGGETDAKVTAEQT